MISSAFKSAQSRLFSDQTELERWRQSFDSWAESLASLHQLSTQRFTDWQAIATSPAPELETPAVRSSETAHLWGESWDPRMNAIDQQEAIRLHDVRTEDHKRDVARAEKLLRSCPDETYDVLVETIGDLGSSSEHGSVRFDVYSNIVLPYGPMALRGQTVDEDSDLDSEPHSTLRIGVWAGSAALLPDSEPTPGHGNLQPRTSLDYHQLRKDYVCSLAIHVALEILNPVPLLGVAVNVFDAVWTEELNRVEEKAVLAVWVPRDLAFRFRDTDVPRSAPDLISGLELSRISLDAAAKLLPIQPITDEELRSFLEG